MYNVYEFFDCVGVEQFPNLIWKLKMYKQGLKSSYISNQVLLIHEDGIIYSS